MAGHIGIVACSAEGAALCYRTICIEGAALMGKHSHPQITMHTYSLSEYMRYIEADNWNGVADLMLSSVAKVTKAGADFAVCPDNTIHQAYDIVVASSSIPWLHIAEEVAKKAKFRGFTRLGLLGTRFLMEGPVYPVKLERLGIDPVVPDSEDRNRINDIIFDELVNGKYSAEALEYFCEVIEKLQNQGCEAVILGCTEIPLLVDQEDSALPILDSTRILARAALRRAVDST